MKKMILLCTLLTATTASAANLEFLCRSAEHSLRLQVTANEKFAQIEISDPKNVLAIRTLPKGGKPVLHRWLRKKENSYSFIKYYGELDAQDMDFAFPKDIDLKSNRRFAAFVTIYDDNGNTMVPGESFRLTCARASQ